MRVNIYPHDSSESIVTTVRNFYGLYAGPAGAKGVSFEDVDGNILVASYTNLSHGQVVYVKVTEEPSSGAGMYGPQTYHSGEPAMQQAYYPGDAQHMPPPQPQQALNYGQPSRPTSRTSRKRSTSPGGGRGRRSASAGTHHNKKSRSRSGYSDGTNGYSSGDGAPGSVSSRTKSEHIGNTEISLDNIVEGGRRKRAKFESSVSSSPSPRLAEPICTTENSAELISNIGAPAVCASADASSHFELVCLAGSSH